MESLVNNINLLPLLQLEKKKNDELYKQLEELHKKYEQDLKEHNEEDKKRWNEEYERMKKEWEDKRKEDHDRFKEEYNQERERWEKQSKEEHRQWEERSNEWQKEKVTLLKKIKDQEEQIKKLKEQIKSLKEQIQKITDDKALTDIKLDKMQSKIDNLDYLRPIATQAKRNHYYLLLSQFIKSYLYFLRRVIFNDGHHDESNLNTFTKIRNYTKTQAQSDIFKKYTTDLNLDTVDATFKEVIDKRIGIAHPEVLDTLISDLSDDGTVTPKILTSIVGHLHNSNASKKIREEYDKIILSADLLSQLFGTSLIIRTEG